MPAPGQKAPASLSVVRREVLAAREPTNADVLHAVEALSAEVNQLRALLAPHKSALTLDPDEIARTMAMLQKARPIPKETPP